MLVFASMLIGHPRLLLAVFFFLVVIHPTLQNMYAHWFLQLSDKLMGMLLLGVVIFNLLRDRQRRQDLCAFNRILFLFLGVAAAGAMVNRVSPIQVLRFFLTYGTFIPAFYAAYFFLRPDAGEARRILKIVIVVFGLQLALNLGWLAGVNPLPNPKAYSVDFAIGSLGGCNIVAYFAAAFLFLLFAVLHTVKDLKTRILTAAGGLATGFQIVIAFTFHVLPPLAALLFFQSLYAVKALRYKTAMLAVSVMVVIGFVYIKDNPRLGHAFGFTTEDMMTASQFKMRWDMMWRGTKGQAYYNIFVRARHDMPAWFLGAGPGNFASGIGMVHRSMLAEKYVNYVYLTESGRREMVGGSITQHVTTGVSAIYSEFGPLGFLLFFGLHALALFHVWRLFRKGAYRSPLRRAFAEAFIPTMLLYLGLNVISNFFENTFMQIGVWLWAGMVWKADAGPEDGKQAGDS